MGRKRQELDDVVRAALLDAIGAHGPITRENVHSASKRLTGQIVNSRWSRMADAAVVERLHKRLDAMRHGNKRTIEQNERLRAEIAALRSQEEGVGLSTSDEARASEGASALTSVPSPPAARPLSSFRFTDEQRSTVKALTDGDSAPPRDETREAAKQPDFGRQEDPTP